MQRTWSETVIIDIESARAKLLEPGPIRTKNYPALERRRVRTLRQRRVQAEQVVSAIRFGNWATKLSERNARVGRS